MTCSRWGAESARRVVGQVWLLLGAAALVACSDDGVQPLSDEGSTGAASGAVTAGPITTTATATQTATDGPGDSGPDEGDSTAAMGDTLELSDSGDDGTTSSESGGGGTESVGSDGDDGDGSEGDGTEGQTEGGTEGDTGGPSVSMTCVSDDDCVLVDTCCECGGGHVDDEAEACAEGCEVSQCAEAGLEAHPVECRFGTCQLADVGCNDAFVTCDDAPPKCPDETLPSIVEGCYTGQCVPPEACDFVPDCTWCAVGETCVVQSTQIGPWYICEPVDPSCEGDAPSCACMGDAVCQDPYICSEGMGDIGCVCPLCG